MLTLGILAIVTLLVVAFAVSMRVDMMASRNFNDAIRARQIADAGVADAIAILRTNTPNLGVSSYYVTQPGFAVSVPYPTGVDGWLFSLGSSFQHTNINCDGSIDSGGANIQVDWIPIIVTNAAANSTNLVGRFCYWVDDEASKININTANQRVNLLSPTPADIDLTALGIPVGDANASHTFAGTYGFATPASWPLAGAGINFATYANNKFYLTAYGVDINLTPWGIARINLNNYTNAIYYLMPNQRLIAVNQMAGVLGHANMANWFGTGQTFANKYGSAQQIAANILDFITTNNVPTDFVGAAVPNPISLAVPAFLGLKATPYLSELLNSNVLAVTEGAPTATQRTISLDVYTQVELWNMYTNSWTIPANTEVFLSNIPPVMLVNSNVDTGAVSTNFATLSPFTISITAGTFNGGPAAFITYPTPPQHNAFAFTYATNSITVITYGSNVVTAILRTTSGASAGRIDYAQIPVAPKTSDPTPVVDTLGNISPAGGDVRAQISEVNDPRVRPVSTDWHVLNSGQGTLGASNSVLNTGVTTGLIVGDGDMSSHIVSLKGRVDSLGELGYIHTGKPWRTLRLQPRPALEAGAGLVPDWFVLDLFSTTSGSVTGRVNINARVDDLQGGSGAIRSAPLQALLNVPALVGLTNNILTNSWVATWRTSWTALTNAAPMWTSFSNVYAFAGQICEVDQVANGGGTDAAREDQVRSVANLITTRSDTFTVWAWGQAIMDVNKDNLFTPGIDLVVGEAKVQAVVQRLAGNQYRVLYYRYLNP
ncbi:MAG: hypothetical protein ABSC38_01365 [Verrucomicrobiia bacterium]